MLADTAEGDVEIFGGGADASVRALGPVQLGHKIAVVPMDAGDAVVKYGVAIGLASRQIEAGEWVHLHNCQSRVDQRSGTFDLHTGQSSDVTYE
jgi:altronate dehydratase small subunit